MQIQLFPGAKEGRGQTEHGFGELKGVTENSVSGVLWLYMISCICQNSSIINTFKINKFYCVKHYLNKAKKKLKEKNVRG